MIVPIQDQAAEVEREVRNREHLYPVLIGKGRLKEDTAEQKLRDLRAAAATMRIIADNAQGLRELLKALRAKSGEEEKTRLLQHPAVAEVLKQFPDAVLDGIAPIQKLSTEQQESPDADE